MWDKEETELPPDSKAKERVTFSNRIGWTAGLPCCIESAIGAAQGREGAKARRKGHK